MREPLDYRPPTGRKIAVLASGVFLLLFGSVLWFSGRFNSVEAMAVFTMSHVFLFGDAVTGSIWWPFEYAEDKGISFWTAVFRIATGRGVALGHRVQLVAAWVCVPLGLALVILGGTGYHPQITQPVGMGVFVVFLFANVFALR